MLVGPPRSILSAVILITLVGIFFYFRTVPGWESSTKPEIPTPPTNPDDNLQPEIGNLVNIPQEGSPSLKPPGSNYSRILVIPKTKKEDIRWFDLEVPEWPLAVYEVDNPNAELTVPKNKGREATVYLTYIIDHYDDLPDIVLFFHAHRYAWHNNILLNQDAALTLKRINLERIARMGYMNSRCDHKPGCPDWIHMDRPEVDWDFYTKPEEPHFSKAIWREVFPGIPPPPALAAQCCAQFAVTRERIRGVPLQRYIFIRDWLMSTDLNEQISGRVLEYTWHYIFTGYFEYCPAAHSCFCDGYGICFGNDKNYQSWNKMFEQRTDAFKEQDRLSKVTETESGHEEWENAQRRARELQDQIRKWDEQLNQEKADAYTRGDDKRNREMERERWE